MRRALIALLLAVALAPAFAPATRPAGALQAPEGGERARKLVERTIANQHHDDDELYLYQRVERRVSYSDNSIASDETYRLVPTGTGRLSLPLARGNQPVGAAEYRKELEEWRKVLEHAIDTGDAREMRSAEQRKRTEAERRQLIDAIGDAFRFTWLDEESEGGRTLARIALDPNPSFQPSSSETRIFKHVRATVWIDVRAAQLTRGEAEITSDISAGAGIVSKIYKGGWFHIEQREVGPGVWFPTRMEYSIRGRMLVFGMAEHKVNETWGYRYVGSPSEALEQVRRELASGAAFSWKR